MTKQKTLEHLSKLSAGSKAMSVGKAVLCDMYDVDLRSLYKVVHLVCTPTFAQDFENKGSRLLRVYESKQIVDALGLPTIEMYGKSLTRQQVADSYKMTYKRLRADIENSEIIPENIKKLWGYKHLDSEKTNIAHNIKHIFPIQLDYLVKDLGAPLIPFHEIVNQ